VQADGEHFLNGGEAELGGEAAGQFFGKIGVTPLGRAGNAVQDGIEFLDARADRARKILVKQEQFGGVTGMDVRAITGFERIPGTGGSQDG
jgi:hypothetical protein